MVRAVNARVGCEICDPLLPNSYFLLPYRLRLGSHHQNLAVRSFCTQFVKFFRLAGERTRLACW